jgi:hypothetical protein
MTTEETARPTLIEVLRLGVRDIRDAAGEAPGLATDFRQLVAGDMQLGVTEMKESAQQAGVATGIIAAAGLLALIGTIFMCLTLMFALDTAMDLWLAALTTTLIIFAGAFIAYQIAMARFKAIEPMPKRAVRSLGKDISWLRAQMNWSEN